MKKILLVLALFPAAVLILFFTFSLLSRSASAAGVINKKLTQCPEKPNCVCSEFPNDSAHTIAPIQIPEGMEGTALSVVKEVLLEMDGEIQNESDSYLAATFTSGFFRFIDDVEIRLDTEASLLHVRSASRAGYSDMGVNQIRVEEIRSLFEKKIQK
ncbi:MAG: DUF1499 domain-containing protein [Anaerolineae bacterium]|jgi:uncharacterized protein (DUF1499 family)|nr:DUF1499 domain-containing protein [Anaerolineae bacterium]MBT7070320.1 DUF1499 domain-containing protein [Anaerolineae bacterium]MBT7324215.1 DUF1499 domain-containing protein [Anaerolineae bacterium]